jgi:hypothetical protein
VRSICRDLGSRETIANDQDFDGLESQRVTTIGGPPLLPKQGVEGSGGESADSLVLHSLAGLRVVHTATQSLHSINIEEDRRRFKRMASRRAKRTDDQATGSSSLKPRRTIFGRRRPRASTTTSGENGSKDDHEGEEGDVTLEMDEDARAKLEQQNTRLAAAAEAEESARRQEKSDGTDAGVDGSRNKDQKKKGWRLFGRDPKPKERRTVWVNVEGVKTDPRGYERNKVRTSKYTLLSFVPKVRTGFSPFRSTGSLTNRNTVRRI